MSYILEALKRSEQERKQQLRPGSFDPEGGILHLRKRQTPVWIYLLVLVLLLNLGLMLGLYWDRLTADESVNETAAPLSIVPAPNAAVIRTPVIETPAVPEMPSRRQSETAAVEMQMDSAPHASTQTGQFSQQESFTYIEPEQSDGTSQDQLPANDIVLSEDGIVSDETEAWDIVAPVSKGRALAETSELPMTQSERPLQTTLTPKEQIRAKPIKPIMLADTTPLLQTLDAGFTSQIPPIAFNSHIFSQSPDARRVMINNIYLREGEGFSGLTVVEICEEYVVFGKQGRHFKLPVMKDWNP